LPKPDKIVGQTESGLTELYCIYMYKIIISLHAMQFITYTKNLFI